MKETATRLVSVSLIRSLSSYRLFRVLSTSQSALRTTILSVGLLVLSMLSADAVQGQPFYEVLHYIESSDGLYGTASGSSLNGDGGGGNHGDGGGVVFRLSLAAAFLRGECNEDGAVDVADAACSLNYLFAGAAEPGCLASLNANGDSEVNVVDPIALLNFLFGDGPAPVAPFPDCGPGTLPADAQLGCADPPNCQ